MNCRAPQCSTEVPADKPFCGPHWHLVPKRLQNRFYHARTDEERVEAIAACTQAAEQAEFGARLL